MQLSVQLAWNPNGKKQCSWLRSWHATPAMQLAVQLAALLALQLACASFSSGNSEQVAYTSVPPGRTPRISHALLIFFAAPRFFLCLPFSPNKIFHRFHFWWNIFKNEI